MDLAWIIALVIVGIAIMFIVVPAVTLRVLARSLRPRIAAALPGGEILLQDSRANSLGLQSWGVFQQRGNGALVLTPTDLWFSKQCRVENSGSCSTPSRR